jgi:hypothetical protein
MATASDKGDAKARIAVETLAIFERSRVLLDEFERNPRSELFASTTTEVSETTESSESTESCESSESSENKENKEGTESSEGSEYSESSESTENNETLAPAVLAPLSDPLPPDLTTRVGEFGPILERIAAWKKKQNL